MEKNEEIMSISAYVFIQCTAGTSKKVTKELSEIVGVQTAHVTTGLYDVVALIEAENVHILRDFILMKIQDIPGVLRTQSNVIVD